MTAGPLQVFLLAGACLSLIGLAFSGILVSRAQRERDRRRMRFASVIAPHARISRADAGTIIAPRPDDSHSPLSTIAWVFGFDHEKTALYPTKWWVILAGTFVVAKVAHSMTADLMGDMSIVALPIAWVFISRRYFSWIEGRRRSLLLQQFPDALSMIVRSIRVGIPVIESIRIVARGAPGPTSGEFATLVDQVAIGSSLEDAVADLARRSGLPEYRFFATALALQNQTGGTLSDTLDGLADVIRKRAALKARATALTSEARASATVLALLPAAAGGLLYLVNPTYMMLLFQHQTGHTLLAMAAGSLITGLLAIRTIIRRSLPS
ncbi:MAG: type II secretion system F family protein [Acetobacteraceae bacterium]